MKWDAIAPDLIETVWGYGFDENMAKKLMDKLTAQSIERRKTLDEFKILEERINWVTQRQEKTDWSLNFKTREAQRKADEEFNKNLKERQKKFTDANYPKTEVLLDSAKENETDKKSEKSKKKSKSKSDKLSDDDDDDSFDFDVQLHEGLRIMGDWIDLLDHPEKLL